MDDEECERCDQPTDGDGDWVNNQETEESDQFWCVTCRDTAEL